MQECPKCGSNKTKPNTIIKTITIIGLLITLIPIIGWVIGPFMLIAALAGVLIKSQKNIELMKCLECKQPFQISKAS